MTTTPNYGLRKPSYEEHGDVADLNYNMDIVDGALAEKMSNPTNAGTQDQILRSDGQGGSHWDNAASQEEVGAAVTEWLEDNIPTGTTVVVDRSLSIDGAAADAKKTGDALSDLKSALSNYGFFDFEKGYRVDCGSSGQPGPDIVKDQSADYGCIIINVSEGEGYYIHAQSNSKFYSYCFYYKDTQAGTLTRLDHSTADIEFDGFVYIPSGCNILIVNNRYTDLATPQCYKKNYATIEEAENLEKIAIIDGWNKAEIKEGRIKLTNSSTFTPSIEVPSSSWHCTVIDNLKCTDRVVFSAYGNNSFKTLGWYKNNGNGTYSYINYDSLDHALSAVSVPNGADTLILNSLDSNGELIAYYGEDVIPNATKPTILNVATYNTGNFTGIDYPEVNDELLVKMRDAVSETEANILAIQSDIYYIVTGATIKSKLCDNFKYYYQHNGGQYNAKGIYSDCLLYDSAKIDYTPITGYTFNHPYFLVSKVVIDGKTVTIVCVHLDWNDDTGRQAQIEQIINYLNGTEYVVVMGDMNPTSYTQGVSNNRSTVEEDLAIWKNAGYKPANADYLGSINTYYLTEMWECDNIIVSSNIDIKRIGTIKKDYMNDHFPFFARLEIY